MVLDKNKNLKCAYGALHEITHWFDEKKDKNTINLSVFLQKKSPLVQLQTLNEGSFFSTLNQTAVFWQATST